MTVDNDLAIEQWNSHFRKLVDRNLYASRSWKALIEGGMESDTLTVLLAISSDCGANPVSQLIESVRSEVVEEIRRAENCASHLATVSEEVARFASDLPQDLPAKI